MKKATLFYKSLLLLTALISFQGFAQNLLVNGGFESGGAGTGFQTNYSLPATAGTSAQREYNILVNPSTMNTANFANAGDHTTGAGNMMVVDGSASSGDKIWELLNGSSIGVVSGQTYTFSYWISSISGTNTTANSANIVVNTNGTTTAPVLTSGSANAPTGNPSAWTQVTYTWTATTNNAQIWITDSQTSAAGNDFALDDFSLVPCLATNVTCGTTTTSSITFNWVPVAGATGYTVSYQINNGPVNSLPTLPSLNLTVNSLNPGDQVRITVLPVGSGCYSSTTQICFAATTCPVPAVSVTQQPTCSNPTGTIVFTSPINTVLPIPSNLYISQVTDANSGSLTYIEIFNGTGATVNLSNYKIKIYNNGSATVTVTCDFALSGNLLNNDVVVIAVGSASNLGGVVPDLTFASCAGVNNNDNIRLATIGDVEFDLWGRTDGTVFTPAGAVGYTYSRNVSAPHPSMTWNPADWTATDWISASVEDYSDVGTYNYQLSNYQYSVVSPTYQVSPTFTNLTPNTYNVTIRDLVSGCVSTPIALTVNPTTTVAPPSVLSITYCPNAVAVPLTATPESGATLNWYGTNSSGGTASATAPTPLTNGPAGSVAHYYVSQTISGCESTRADLQVFIGRPPIAGDNPFLFCDGANTTATSVAFDFNNIRYQLTPPLYQTSWSYSYTINGGTPITGTHTGLSHFDVPVTTPGATVIFTITWNGICTPSQTETCYAACAVTPVLNITNPAAVCSPNTVDITQPAVTAGSTGGGSLSYWTNAAATTSLTNPTAITISGTYYIKSSVGSCSDINPVVVTINPTPVLNITNPAAVCAPNTIDITLPAVTAGSTGGGTLSYWTNAAATTALANPSAVAASGTYYIKSTLGSCSDIEPVTVTINPTPVLTITNPAAVCSPNTVNITLPAVTSGSTGGGTLSYWTNAAATTALANPTAIAISGTYYIKTTLGSCLDIEPVVVTITSTPSLTVTNPAAVCSPNTIDITLPAVTAGSTGGGTLSYWTNAAATTPLANPTAVDTNGTYYIKSTVGTCFDIEPVTVTINPTPVLSITNPASICSPNTVDITLPAVTSGSTGGGTLSYWSNATATTALANPTAIAISGTYYIKSSLGNCSDINPVVVTINPTPVLSITNPGAVCTPNAIDITLPAVTAGSTGGGTLSYWTNAAATTALVNPTAVTTSGTYYIKSTLGNCSDIDPVTVTINPTPVLSITNPAAVCSPNTVDITLPAVTAGSTGGGTLSYWTNATATTALVNPTAVGTSGTYYIKSTLGNCSDIKPVTVTINNPNLIITNPPTVCSPDTVDLTLPAVTAGSTGGGILSYWTNAAATMALANPNVVATGGTYYIKSTVGTCFDIEPVVVTINANFVVNNPLPLESCDPNNDGFVTFDLTQTSNSITGGNPGYIVSFHETQVDAVVNGTSIPTPANYDNINPFLQTVYVRVSSNTSTCFQIVQLQLIIHLTPVATEPDDYELCDYTGAPGYETFDLTTTIPQVLGSLNPSTHAVTFYTSQAAAESGTGNITNTTSYINGSIDTETIYVRVENTATGCYDIITLQLIVNPLPNATQPNYPQYSLCDTTGLVGFEVFDLASRITPILLGQTGMDVSFY
ncbi:hypothetical protein, partial [Flavobacterium sp.]|uniref:hypothetical protein n=1 Tax=Flavobacterium sp. TaxID=239 RepID=UPI0025EDAF1A